MNNFIKKILTFLIVLFITISVIYIVKGIRNKHINNLNYNISMHLENGEYEEAFIIYKNQKIEYQELILSQIETYEKELCEEALKKLELENIIDYIDAGWDSTLVTDTIIKIESKIINLETSAENYTNGVSYYNQRNFDEAKINFESVIEDDINYQDAQNYIDEIDLRDKSWNENTTSKSLFYNALCFDGEYLYIPFAMDGIEGIFKISAEGETVAFFPLSNDSSQLIVSCLNVVGEYIYFIAGENVGSGYTFDNPYCIYEMKTDGTNLAVVKEGNFTDLFIKNDKVYAVSREFGLIEYDKDFEEQGVICADSVVELSFDYDGIYYTVQEDLTNDNDNSLYYYDGIKSSLIDSKEYMHYYGFDDVYVKQWQNSNAFETVVYYDGDAEKQIRNADIYKVYGIIDDEILYSCNGVLGQELLYTYQIGTKITNQLVDFDEIIDYEILGIFYEQSKLVIIKDNTMYFTDINISNLQEINTISISNNMLEQNTLVTKHLEDSDIYLDSQEEIISVINDKQIWHYKNDKLNVTIEKRYVDEYDCNVYVTHLFTNDYSLFTTGNGNTESITSSTIYKASYISNLYQMIYAQNTDTYTYNGNSDEGMIIRHGEVIRDEIKEDMIVYFSDGSMEVYRSEDEITAQELIDEGVVMSFSFGPILVDEYEIDISCVTASLASRNPRSAIGYVEPGHYVMVVCDGRYSSVSRGLNMVQLARIFEEEGCRLAYNLDGGMTSTVLFMGNYINDRPLCSSGSKWCFYRSVSEMVYFGSSDQSPADLEQYMCDYNYFAENYK